MRTKPFRTVLATAVAGVAATAAALACFDSGADAAASKSSDITGGTTTLSMSVAQLTQLEASGLNMWQPAAPASTGVDPSSGDIDYTFPVTGGDASVTTFYGMQYLAGDLVLSDHNTGKSVRLRELRFNIADDTITAVPSPTHTRMVFFDALGNHQFSGKASAPPETFSASDLQIDAAGASYLDSALGENVVSAGESVGAFSTSFTNTVN